MATLETGEKHQDLLLPMGTEFGDRVSNGLSDENGREREVERRAVEVKAVAGRQDEADDAPRHAEPG